MRTFSLSVIALVLFPILAYAQTYSTGFEAGLDGWNVGSDVPAAPQEPFLAIPWGIRAQTHFKGDPLVHLFLSGDGDDGTIWIARFFHVAPNTAKKVRLAFDLFSAFQSDNLLANVAAFGGGAQPLREADFDVSQPANQVAGWKRYEYEFNVISGPDEGTGFGRIWVAAGVSVVFETDVEYDIDNLSVELLD